jgi:hypothetical protein
MGNPPQEYGPGLSRTEWQFPSWKKIGEFVANVMQLKRCVETLKEYNRKLQEQVDTRAERAAVAVFERLITFKSNEKPEDRP